MFGAKGKAGPVVAGSTQAINTSTGISQAQLYARWQAYGAVLRAKEQELLAGFRAAGVAVPTTAGPPAAESGLLVGPVLAPGAAAPPPAPVLAGAGVVEVPGAAAPAETPAGESEPGAVAADSPANRVPWQAARWTPAGADAAPEGGP